MPSNPAPDSPARARRFRHALIAAAALAVPCHAAQLSLLWDPSTTGPVAGYFVYVGDASRTYTARLDAGNSTGYTVGSLADGRTYYFTVAAYDSVGGTSVYSNELRATTPSLSAPTAGLSASPVSGTAPLAVAFSSVSSGNITGYLWDFGDGSSSTAQNPSHTYSKIGTYTFMLTVTGPGGSSSATGTITTTGCRGRSAKRCT